MKLACFRQASFISIRHGLFVERISLWIKTGSLKYLSAKFEEKNMQRTLPIETRSRHVVFQTSSKRNEASGFTPSVSFPVLRLRGGTSGDEETWLCDICGKKLVSKRNLNVHMNSAHVSHPDYSCVTSSDGLLKWKCTVCGNYLSSKQRVISHLIKTHGRTNFLAQAQKQTLNS